MGTGRWDDDGRRDQGRPPQGGRTGSRGGGDGWDRSPRGGSRNPRRDDESWDDIGRGGSSGRGARGNWDGGRGGSPDRSGDRSMRGGRPPVREDRDGQSRGGRGGAGGPGGPGYNGASRRPPQGGGLWGDEDYGQRGRSGLGGPAGMRDPRAARGRFAPEPEKGKLSFSKAAAIVFGMFVLGIAVAFGFFLLTKPNPQVDNITPAPTTTAPATTPTTAPKVTPSPSGSVPHAGPAYVFVPVGGDAGQ